MVRQGLQPLNAAQTYYLRTASDLRPRAALTGAVEADACVVGAGLAGLSAGLELAQRGRRVCVLDGEGVAWGASGRNGGFVTPGYAADHQRIARRVGAGHARELHRLSIEGVQAVADNIARLAMADAHRVDGILSVSRCESAARLTALRDWHEREFGYRLEYRSRAQVRELLRSQRYHEALYNPHGFHIQPLNYARALAREIERLGGSVFEASPACALAQQQAVQIVRTPTGEVRARDVIVASGGYTGRLLPQLRRSYLPIATYVLLTRPDAALIGSAIRTPAAIADGRRAGDYYRLVDSGERILWGGKITTRTSEPRRLARLLRASMIATYPQLADLEIDIAWSGLMSYARHLMPQIGRLRDGLWYCTAFGGHGLNTTAIGGRVVAEAITGQSDRVRLFEPFGLDWNGGYAGRVAVQATYWSLQALDFAREHGLG